MAITGSTIIIWFYSEKYREPFLLVGKESKYVIDKYPASSSQKQHIEEFQSYNPTNTSLSKEKLYFEVAENFRLKSRQLENELGIGRIHYDTPEFNSETGIYTVNYRYLDSKYKRGLIKGGIKDRESPMGAIIREVGEETGTSISAKRDELVELGACESNSVFALDILDEATMKKFLDNIKSRVEKRKGEVFELSFKQLSQVVPLLDAGTFNRKSTCAMRLFIDYYNSLHVSGEVSSTKSATAATVARSTNRARKMSKRRSKLRHNKRTMTRRKHRTRSKK